MERFWVYQFDGKEIAMGEDGEGICALYFGRDRLPENAQMEKTPLLEQAAGELQAYFSGKRKDFTVPLSLKGTDFQKKVWNALRQIPYGATKTYGQIANEVGSPKGFRAVGMANHSNPVSIMVPCHRVIGKDGKLTGYAGGLDIKQYLLRIERDGTET